MSVVAGKVWHQHEYIGGTNVCGGAAPVVASICNPDSAIAVTCLLEFVEQLLFKNDLNVDTQLSSEMQQQLSILETLMIELNDSSYMRRMLGEIKLEIEEKNLNPLNDKILHP
eukprot:751821_1